MNRHPYVMSTAEGPLILVVDDNASMRSALSLWLTASLSPCRVQVAATAEAGVLTACRLPHPTVVLMDLNLPAMNGIDATRLIKAASPDTNVIIFTLSDAPAYRDEAFAAGACAYTLKSRARQELLPLLRRFIAPDTPTSPYNAQHTKQTTPIEEEQK